MMNTNKHGQAHPAGNIKKTTLSMSLAIGLGGIFSQPMAAFSTSTQNYTLGTSQVVACNYGTIPPCNKASYAATDIAGAGFTTVAYNVYLEGSVLGSGIPPITQPDMANTIVGNTINLDVLANDSSADGLDTGSVAIETAPVTGTATPRPDGIIDYDPQAATAGDAGVFTYTVDSLPGIPSAPTDVDVTIESNVNPVANDDSAVIETVVFENAGGQLEIDVLANDTDANNDPGLPGGIDVTTINILTQPSTGACVADPVRGTITYSQAPPSVAVSTSCTYEVMDIDSFEAPLTSNVATVDIDIIFLGSDWPIALDPDIIPFLVYEDGVPNASGSTADVPESGTYFSMDVSATTTIYTTMTKGSDGGFVIGYDQISGNSHMGSPTGNEITTVDRGWSFFGNTGMTLTKNGGITDNSDGTLKFSGDPGINGGEGRYQMTWNGISNIDLGGSGQFPEDLGFGRITCNPAPCADGSTFELNYEAHVPPGDPSGFGGVQYRLVMNGEVKFLDGAFQTSSGIFSVEDRLSASDVPPDPDSEVQCASGCFDYTITGVTEPGISVLLPLNGGVKGSTPDSYPQMRVFRDGAWSNFNTSGSDSVLSAPFIEGGSFGTICPPHGDAAYVTLTEGHQCLQVTIADNGLNDKDPVVGTITDPSGVGVIRRPLNQSPDCDAATANPSEIWPPNHKMVSVAITGVTDPDGDAVTVTVDSVSQDEAVTARGNGAGKTTPDATMAPLPLAVRAERNGNRKTPGDGRVYHIDFNAVDENGNVCTGSTTVCVPHDKGRGSSCTDGGPLYDSTAP